MREYPESIAIGGAWGYIGRKFLDAAAQHGIATFAFDPGQIPEDLDPTSFIRLTDENEFCSTEAELFHLAMHPEHRQQALDRLLPRAGNDKLAILNEKPMAAPESPEQSGQLIDAVNRAKALMLFDFPELFDPLTEQILNYLRQFSDVRITDLYVCRSKDREDPANARNRKRMVPIQYQESVHCLAFVLHLLGRLRGDLASVFAQGITAAGESEAYQPPNPENYPYVVDGKCRYSITLGTVRVDGLTDFKAGAPGRKQRVISGTGDGGKPFQIDVNFQEGQKYLKINGQDQSVDPSANSYANVLRTFTRWRQTESIASLMSGVYPNPAFAQATYLLSSVLWRCCYTGKPIRFSGLEDLIGFDARFREAISKLATYRSL